jgi:hypothetical protein
MSEKVDITFGIPSMISISVTVIVGGLMIFGENNSSTIYESQIILPGVLAMIYLVFFILNICPGGD